MPLPQQVYGIAYQNILLLESIDSSGLIIVETVSLRFLLTIKSIKAMSQRNFVQIVLPF